MALNLKELKPTQVSRDLKGKFIFLYGAPKVGKTTLAVQFPRNLLLAVEKGYNAIDGIMAVDVTSWSEFLKYLRQLQDDEVKAMFDTVTIK